MIDAGGSTLDLAICRAHGPDPVLTFTLSEFVGSITDVCGANYFMRLEKYLKKRLDQGSNATRGTLTWPVLQQHVRQQLKESTVIERVLQDSRCRIILKALGEFADDTSAGIVENQISLSG